MKVHRYFLLAPLIALLPSSSCHSGHHHPDVIVVVESDDDPSISELEPNDDAFSANDLGFLAPGDSVVIRGEIVDCCDPFDGFAFVSTAPLLVEFTLESHDGGDLDLCVYDPGIDDFSVCYENGGTVESGAFEVLFGGAAFHTVVAPFDFGSRYTLEIFASPLPLAKALESANEDGEAPANVRAVDGAASDGHGTGHHGERAARYRGQTEEQVQETLTGGIEGAAKDR